MTEEEQKADLIKKALTIVDELAGLDVDDKDDTEDIYELIEKAEKLKRDRFWKLN